MPLPTHLPHIIYATALTSLALHLLSTRKAGDAARRQAAARIGLLDGLAVRLRAGERVPPDEVARVQRLLRDIGTGESRELVEIGDGRGGALRADAEERDVGWKAVLLGRKSRNGSLADQGKERDAAI
ncbi:hypothetical protein M0805_002489 [Coniferiporia weirii]|nr:hypothetical protein M0805_002489 [Coniferiporia weirii]